MSEVTYGNSDLETLDAFYEDLLIANVEQTNPVTYVVSYGPFCGLSRRFGSITAAKAFIEEYAEILADLESPEMPESDSEED